MQKVFNNMSLRFKVIFISLTATVLCFVILISFLYRALSIGYSKLAIDKVYLITENITELGVNRFLNKYFNMVNSIDSILNLNTPTDTQNYLYVLDTYKAKDNNIIASIADEKKVMYEGEIYSLTALTKKILNIEHAIQPTGYWMFNGKNLRDIYDETYTLE